MIDTFEFLDELKGTFEPSQAEVLARLMGRLYKELANTVTKAEFAELTRVVNELSNNIKTLSERIDRLAEFQVKAEERFAKVEERLTRLEKVVEELAEAQKKTEERLTRLEKVVEELAEAQKRTEERLNELAEAQKKTEEVIKELAKDLGVTKRQLGDLSDTVGYTLENSAYKALPELLKRDYGIKVIGRLKRGYLRDIHGRPVEVNILGEATKNGKRITIIGESKARLSKKAIDKFVEKRLKAFGGVIKDIFPVIVTHMVSEPDAEEHAKKKGVALYYSYDF
jgi:DNA repair exonuclease SbcCD ATPase subunit